MRITLSSLVLLLLLASDLGAAESSSTPPYLVIVHPDNKHQSLDRKWVADAFLKKTTRWSGDVTIRPVDAKPASSSRQRFSKDILKRSVSSVKNYWQQLIFSGRGTPPPELDSDEAIVSYVLKHPGAIGYVSAAADLKGAKIVDVK